MVRDLKNVYGRDGNADCIWEFYENIGEYCEIKGHYNYDDEPDYTEEQTSAIIKFLKNELMKKDDNKRPIVFYKNELYVRNVINLTIYAWELMEIPDFIKSVINEFWMYFDENMKEHMTEESMIGTSTFYAEMEKNITEKEQKKIMKAIMPYILMK